jgi:hypothetical protein
MTVLRFRALAAGKTVISLINAKPAQGDVPSISRDTLAVSVEVN